MGLSRHVTCSAFDLVFRNKKDSRIRTRTVQGEKGPFHFKEAIMPIASKLSLFTCVLKKNQDIFSLFSFYSLLLYFHRLFVDSFIGLVFYLSYFSDFTASKISVLTGG